MSDRAGKKNGGRYCFSLAEKAGFFSCTAAAALLFVDIRLSMIPLVSYLLLCMVAPFFPRFGYYLPVISRGKSGKKAVAITFDDGPDPLSTPALLDLLDMYHVKATFFVIGKRVSLYPDLIAEIVSRGHSLGNHTDSHDPLIMFRSPKTLTREVAGTQEALKALGVRTDAFRAPAGITGPRLGPVLRKLGLYAVHFSCRGLDLGNRRIRGLAKRILSTVVSGDIIALHDIRPKSQALTDQWLKEVETILGGLKTKGMEILPLSELIEKPVMMPLGARS